MGYPNFELHSMVPTPRPLNCQTGIRKAFASRAEVDDSQAASLP